MTLRPGLRPAALAIAAILVLCAGGAAALAASKHGRQAANPANDKLLGMKPPDRAALLAKAVGHWCIGTEAFLMGVSATGRGAGDAYWSLRCADGSSWALQIDPRANVAAVDCATFKAQAEGRECFKKF